MSRSTAGLSVCLILSGSLPVRAQNFTDIDFSRNIQATNAVNPNNSTLGPDYYAGLQLDFADVAWFQGASLGVDARVEINYVVNNNPISPGYEFVGYIPDYNQASNQPEGDLGVYYKSQLNLQNQTIGGITFTISFFESGSNFSVARELMDFRLLMYDHDGEPGQSESIRLYGSDGLTGYQLGSGSGIHTHHENDTVRFDSRGEGHPEDSADGGFIAYYHNTSVVRFDMFATTETWLPAANNGIFAAIDGDLSLTGGSTAGFNPYVPIPEPSFAAIAAGAAACGLFRRSRGT